MDDFCIQTGINKPGTVNNFVVNFHDSISDIGADEWNSLAGVDNPFNRYEFLWSLENTGCTSRASGWQPCHLQVRDETGDDSTVALMPLYQKTNSWGEYVFDWAWANAYERHGLDYYPKLVSSVPFTPSPGKRLFVRAGVDSHRLIKAIKSAIEARAASLNASSWHVLFPTEQEHNMFSEAGLMSRIACQFQWLNYDYQSFDDFLSRLSSRKRKNLKKERSRVQGSGISFEIVEGAAIDEPLWDIFYTFYQSTYLIRGMQGYLNKDFFAEVASVMPEQLLMVCAKYSNKIIATALFFKSSDTLFGRYWGSERDYQYLHFETCYYQGQEYAIRNRLDRFDSGAQGEHKIQRGFEPTITYSNHWLAEAAFADAIQDFLGEERKHILRYRRQAEQLLPFRKDKPQGAANGE